MLKLFLKKGIFEKILLFLFVNQKACHTEVAKLLEISLTRLEKAFQTLENSNVVKGFFIKNKRYYEISKEYPLYEELIILLKKAYFSMSVEQKNKYCFVHKPYKKIQEEIQRNEFCQKELLNFFKRLKKVSALNFKTISNQETREGQALVVVQEASKNQIIFQEKGIWTKGHEPGSRFYNSFSWTLDLKNQLLSLHHLRYGEKKPVFLLQFTPYLKKKLHSVQPHQCSEDTYLAHIEWSLKKIELKWRVIGPKKNDFLTYQYS